MGEGEALLALWRRAGAVPSITDTIEDIEQVVARGSSMLVVAEVGGQIVGSIIGSFDGWRGNIYRLAVDPSHQRRGIARLLVAEIEEWLAGQGAKRITAIVVREHPWAVGFWNAVGYEDVTGDARFARDLGA
jgi:ribosomal protein S18 acetylase RimI-like enzyme